MHQNNYKAVADALNAANNTVRGFIITTLLSHPHGLSVNEITDNVRSMCRRANQRIVEQPTISSHLKVLAETKIVFCFPNGKFRIYALADCSVDTLNKITNIWASYVESL